MEDFWSGARQLPFEGARPGSYVGAPFRGVLHTAEAKTYTPSKKTYYGHTSPPHFTLVKDGSTVTMFQHYPISRSARALQNLSAADPHSAGVETNRQNAIQIEIAWVAKEIASLPQPMKQKLKEWMRWVELQTGVVRKSPRFFGSRDGAGFDARSRMRAADWQAFNGWCGHQHVPENDHWDPGLIDIQFLLAD